MQTIQRSMKRKGDEEMSEIMERHTKKVKTSKSDIHIANFLKNTQIYNDTDLDRLTEYAEQLAALFEAGNKEIEPLFDYVVKMIETYEDIHYPVGKSSPLEMLKFLMDQHGHKQKDLTDIAPKSTISEILSGKKDMSKSVIRKLAEKYHTNPSVLF